MNGSRDENNGSQEEKYWKGRSGFVTDVLFRDEERPANFNFKAEWVFHVSKLVTFLGKITFVFLPTLARCTHSTCVVDRWRSKANMVFRRVFGIFPEVCFVFSGYCLRN